jgi:hypothetical protein
MMARDGEQGRKDILATVRQVLLVHNLETDSLQRIPRHRDRPHLGDTVSKLDPVLDLLVTGVRLVKVVGHAPLVDAEGSSRLEDLEDLAVDTLPVRGVAGSLDGAVKREVQKERRVGNRQSVQTLPDTDEGGRTRRRRTSWDRTAQQEP